MLGFRKPVRNSLKQTFFDLLIINFIGLVNQYNVLKNIYLHLDTSSRPFPVIRRIETPGR